MMRTLYAALTTLLIFSCAGPATDQSETADTTSTVTDPVVASDPPPSEEQVVVFNPDDKTPQAVFLKWKNVSYSDYGPLYVFEDRKGEELRIRIIQIPEWDFERNDYLDVAYPANSDFPEITIKEPVVGKWYKAIVQMETRELDGAEQDTPVLQSLELVYSFD